MIQVSIDPAKCGTVVRAALLLSALALVGCGPREAKVSGRVFLDAAPIPGGRVTFRPADPSRNTVSAELDEQGNYQATLPLGEVKVCFDNRELEPVAQFGGVPPGLPASVQQALADKMPAKASEAPPKKASSRYVEVPEKYYTFDTSELQFTVEREGQKHDIKLAR